MIVVPLADANDFTAYRNAATQMPETASSRHQFRLSHLARVASYRESVETLVSLFEVGDRLVETMDLRLVEGRDFDPKMETDLSSAILVNQRLVREFGWDQSANWLWTTRGTTSSA